MQNENFLKEHPKPPSNFQSRSLPTYESSGKWYRLNPVHHNSALYFDRSGKGRFDGENQPYGILYVGEDEYAAFIESYGRVHGSRGVAELDIKKRNLVAIESKRSLVLADLTGNGLVKIGADTRLTSGSYETSRFWAKTIFEHPIQVDGLRYRSRHDPNRVCCGLFDRTNSYLSEENLGNLVDRHPKLLAEILEHYNYGLL
jgi:hypothetical protein